jgi:hypothetical protein
MLGKMSVAVLAMEYIPDKTISTASTRKVYGRRSAILTIHIRLPLPFHKNVYIHVSK